MKKVIFHIGLPKTATTLFQKMIFPSLNNAGFITTLNQKDFDMLCNYRELKKTDLYEKLTSELRYNDTVIVSDEKLTNAPQNILNIGKSIEYFKKMQSVDIIVFIVLRNQEQFAISYWKYWVMRMVPHKKPFMEFDNWLDYQQKHVMLILQYNVLLKSLLLTLKREEIIVHLYEDFLRNRNEFIHKTFSDLEICVPQNLKKLRNVNKSISNFEMMLKKRVGFIEGKHRRVLWKFFVAPMIKELRRLPLQGFNNPDISQKARAAISTQVGDGNKWIQDYFKLDLGRWDYPGL